MKSRLIKDTTREERRKIIEDSLNFCGKGSCDFCGAVDEQAAQFAGYCICSACRKKIGAL